MPSLSSSNRSQLNYKLEGTYPTGFGVPQGGNGMTSETLDATPKYETSKQIRSDRQTVDAVLISASAQGGFNFEAQFKEYDPFIEGVFQNVFTAYGTAGVGAAVATLTLASGTVTAGVAPTGNDAFTGLSKGQWFTIKPAAGASQAVKDYFKSRPFRVSNATAPSTTVITLDAVTPIDTAKAGTSLSGASISSSRMYNANTMKSYTLEVAHEDIGQYRQYVGMIPSKMDMKLSVGSIVTGMFDFMGQSFNLLQATSMGTPTAPQGYTPANATKGVFDVFENGASVGLTTFIKSADFSFDNSLRAQEAVGVFGNAGVAAGTIKVTGKLEVYFADQTIYQKVLTGNSSSMTIPILDVDGNGYVWHFARTKYTAAKVNTGGLDQDNMLSVDFMAVLDVDPTSSTYQKTAACYRV